MESGPTDAFEMKVLSLGDLDEVLTFAKANLALAVADEAERTFLSWDAKWRREALEHYLRLSWSFIAREKGTGAIVGFFLAQPIRFFRGQTQTLWIEHVEAREASVAELLLDLAIRSARAEHLQRVLFQDQPIFRGGLVKWPHSQLDEAIIEVKTTKG
jgi:hypothetical protein